MPPQFRRASDDVRSMTPARLREAYCYPTTGRVPVTYVLRAVVLAIIDEVEANPAAWTFEGGVRDMFHQYAEPVLARLRPQERAKNEPPLFGDMLAEQIVGQGRTTYRALRMTDHLWEHRRIGVSRPDVLVVGEKLGLSRLLHRIHELEDVSTLCLNGYPNLITCEYTALHVADAMAAAGLAGPVHIIALVDHDPYGAHIAVTLQSMLGRMGLTDTRIQTPFHPRLLTEEELPRARYPVRERPGDKASVRTWLDERARLGEASFGVAVDGADWHRLEDRVRGWIADV